MGRLWKAREEQFCQHIAAGESPPDAKLKAGYKSGADASALLRRQHISTRVSELLERAANRAEASRADIISAIQEEAALARRAGQHAAALKAYEMLGKELHKMFIDRKEVGGPGDFDNKTEEELKEFIAKELKSLGMELDNTPPVKLSPKLTLVYPSTL